MEDQLRGRITELEISLAHLQRLFEQLNEVVTEEASRSDRLQREVRELKQQLRSVKEKPSSEQRSLEEEKPPHY